MTGLLLFLTIIALGYISHRQSEKDGRWILEDGGRKRRWVRGKWEYAAMTDAELEEHAREMAW